MRSNSTNASDCFAVAETKYKNRDYQGAIDSFSQSIAIQENWDSYRGLGWALMKTNQHVEAIDAFRQSLALKKDWSSYQGLGGTLFNTKQYREAIDAFRKSLALKEDWNSYLGLGTALLKTNQYSEAIDAFRKSLALKEDWNSYLGLGTALLRTNQYSEAINAFRKSLEHEENWSSFNGLGLALLKTNQLEESIDSFTRSVALKEGSDYAWKKKDKNLSLLIGASRYSFFHKRILIKNTDYYYYSPVYNELQDLVCLCPWETECLYRYATFAQEGIVEIGRARGGSTLLFTLSNPYTKIISIDISSKHDENLKGIFEKLNCGKNVDLLIGDANEVQEDVINSGFSFDFLFIDGDHSYEGCLKDLNTWFPSLSNGGLIVFHDAFSDQSEFEWGWDKIGVFEAIMEFSRHNVLEFIIPPSSTSRFWENPHGSLCIARKPDNSKLRC